MLDANFASWLIGLIWALFCGLAIGNYATNPIYRLPRNEPLFGRKPYCGDCNAELKPKDLFPILSWLSTMGKCRYCGASVPGAYVVAEILVTILFVVLYWKMGFSDAFILIGFGGTALIMLVMMQVIDRYFCNKTLLFFIVMGALYRVLEDGAISGGASGAFYTAVVALTYWWWNMRSKVVKGHLPDYVKLWVAAGIWLAPQALLLFALLWAIFEALVRISAYFKQSIRGGFPITASYAAAFFIPLLYPNIVTLLDTIYSGLS